MAPWQSKTNSAIFRQHVRDKDSCGEEFYGWYKLSETETEELVRKHLARFGITFQREERNSVGRHYVYYHSFQNPYYYFVQIMNDPGVKEIHAHATRSIEKPLYY